MAGSGPTFSGISHSGLRVPVDPRYMDVRTWANFLVQDFGDSMLPILMSEDEWQTWAMRVIEKPAFANAGAPRPDGFTDWRSWAERIVGLSIS